MAAPSKDKSDLARNFTRAQVKACRHVVCILQRLLRFTRTQLLCALALAVGSTSANAEPGTVNLPALNPATVVHAMDYSHPEMLDFLQASLIDAIMRTDGWPLKFSLTALKTLRTEKAPSADIIFAGPSVSAGLYRFAGYRPLLSLVPKEAASAGEAAAAALFVPRNAPVRTIHSLAKEKILTNNNGSIVVKTYLAADLSRQGVDPKRMLKNLISVQEPITVTVQRMLAGEAPAVLLPACDAMRLPQSLRDKIRLVGQRLYDGLACPHSTKPGPGWMILVSTKATKEHADWLKAHFLAGNRPNSPYRWAENQHPSELISLMTDGNDPYFEQFRNYSWREIVRENTGAVLAAILALAALLFWSIASTFQLSRRTTALLQTQERLGNLERISIVGQMSSMVAHELRQPLFAIRNYAGSLKRRRERGALTDDAFQWGVQRIVEESNRANDIIEHVRAYAKGRPEHPLERADLSEAVAKSYARLRSKLSFRGRFVDDIQPGIEAEFDPLEIDLVLRTLVKNAVEASTGNPDEEIRVTLAPSIGYEPEILLEVADNGIEMTPEALARLGTPVHSNKTQGLGLGLSIVSRIVERSGGTIRFCANHPRGLIVRILLPKEMPHVDNPDPS